MSKKKSNKPSDVEQAAPQQSIIEEAGLDSSKWQVVDTPAINPNQPQGISPAPVNNSLTSGPLPPNFGYQPALVNTGYPASTGPIGLMPIQGGPQVNSKSIGVTRTIIQQGTGGSGSGSVSPIITLQTNGAMNPNQSVLNLIGGANIAVTSDAGGGVTFASGAHEVSVNGVAAPGPEVNFNNTTPAAPAGKTNVLFQTDGASPITGISANMPLVVGDSGSGGTSGAVPAPPSGSAAANKFFKADATFAVPPNMVGDSGSGGVAGYVPAPPAGSATAGKFLKADGTFAIPSATAGAATTVLKTGSAGGNYTTTSGSLVQVDGTNLIYTVTIPIGSKLLINCSGTGEIGNDSVGAIVALTDGGTVLQSVEGSASTIATNIDSLIFPFALNYVITGDGASHAVDLRFSTTGSHTFQILNSGTLIPIMVFLLLLSN